MSHRVLLVEDDDVVRAHVARILEDAGFEVHDTQDGAAAAEEVRLGAYDLVILDVTLPSMSGFEVCSAVRRHSAVPIVMLTARSATSDVVKGLELGADDYVTKPFEPTELRARALAAVRRNPDARPERWRARDLELDESAYRVCRDAEEVPLSSTEFRLLVALASRPGHAMSRENLLEQVWGYDYLGDSRLVDMAVLRLRAKLGEPDAGPPYIETVRSVGYRFEQA